MNNAQKALLPVVFLPEGKGKTVSEVRKIVDVGKSYMPFVKGELVGEDHIFDGYNLDFKKV